MNYKIFPKALFSPNSIALVGASGNLKKNSARPLRYLLKYGYKGKIYLVNPNTKEIQGLQTVASIKNLPMGIEHFFVMVHAKKVKDVLEQAIGKNVKVVTIFSDGFAEKRNNSSSTEASSKLNSSMSNLLVIKKGALSSASWRKAS